MPVRPDRLLVVDDNEDNRDMLARRLRRRGYEVETASDGNEALHRIREGDFDLVVLDIMMPGLSGIEVLREVRKTYPRAELPILMASAKSESEDMVDALELGANDYVTKPIDFPVVLARIQSHLQTRLQGPSLPAPAALLPADGRAAPGTILDGRFEVEGTLGEGGFAFVFQARQLSTGQPVAVKVLRSQRARGSEQARERQRFEHEMRVIGELKHPHIVRLIDFGDLKAKVEEPKTAAWSSSGTEEVESAEGEVVEETTGSRTVLKRLPYIVMERVEGETLQAYLAREAPLENDAAIGIFLPVISAVAAAHRAEVVHRDLKPPNIMISHGVSGLHPLVLDFGIAKPTGEDPSHHAHRDLMGTPEYMAPEQLRGEITPRADQYALAAMLYEALSGTRPVVGDSPLELVQHVYEGRVAPLVELRPEVGLALASDIARAMRVLPEERFPTVAAFGRALLDHASDGLRARWSDAFPDTRSAPGRPHDDPRRAASSKPAREPPIDPPFAPRGVERGPDGQAPDAPGAPSPLRVTSPRGPWLALGIGALVVGGAALAWWLG